MAVKAGFIILATQETEAGELDVLSSQANLARACNIFKKDGGNLNQGERLLCIFFSAGTLVWLMPRPPEGN